MEHGQAVPRSVVARQPLLVLRYVQSTMLAEHSSMHDASEDEVCEEDVLRNQEAQRARNVKCRTTSNTTTTTRKTLYSEFQTFYDKEKHIRVPQSYRDADGYPRGRAVSDRNTFRRLFEF